MTAQTLGFLPRFALAAWLLVLTGCDLDSAARHLEQLPPARISDSVEAPRDEPRTIWSGNALPSVPSAAVDGTPTATVTGSLTAYFFDVGQGDATLLAGPDCTIVIDAGRHDRKDVVPLLESAGVQSIDLLIATHPHADHIGQFAQILETFPVREVWMSGEPQPSRTFERTLDAVLSSGAAYHEPRAGESYRIGSARVEVLNPVKLIGDLHASSVCVRISFGQVAFVFTGDAETPTEREMIQRGQVLSAQILQLGHHGSRTSSAPEFLYAVQPQVAIYSAGEGNSYGHPHEEVLQRLTQMGITVLGTDRHGTIRVTTDGSGYQITTERGVLVASPPREPVYAR